MFRYIRTMSNTIRKRLLFLFLSTTLLTSIVSFYVYFTYANLTENMGNMFETSTLLENLQGDLNEANTNLYSFLISRNNESLLGFSKMADKLKNFSEDSSFSGQMDLYMKNIANLIPSYLTEANLAIDARRGRDPGYIDHYDLANRTLQYIQKYSDSLNIQQLQKNTNLYRYQSRYIGWFRLSSIIMIADLVVLNIFLVLYITYKMTDPILRLSRASEEISEGNFETEDIPVTGEDEIRVMALAFNRMKNSIHSYILELHNQTETETMLLEQQMQNMKMQNLLDSSRLQALQAQINPHFLFNTLNAGIQLSIMEGSDRTTEFLENLSDLFRYNITKPGSIVTLKDEILHVKSYTELMKVRFGDSIQFIFDIDESVLSTGIPPLTIQTLVENACIHGLGNVEKGIVRIRVSDSSDQVQVAVSDSGVGIEPDIINDIFHRSTSDSTNSMNGRTGHTTGIGLTNVIQRLRLHSSMQDVLHITSVIGKGTTVTVYIKKEVAFIES